MFVVRMALKYQHPRTSLGRGSSLLYGDMLRRRRYEFMRTKLLDVADLFCRHGSFSSQLSTRSSMVELWEPIFLCTSQSGLVHFRP